MRKLFLVSLLFLIFCLLWITSITNWSYIPYAPSVYHVYVPRFKRDTTSYNEYNESIVTNKNSRYEERILSNEGNLRGIVAQLNYIQSLNVDYLYLSPFFKSPKMDGGYDVSDYYHVDPYYGNDSDFNMLLTKAKSKQLKVIIDLVLNHTSYQHEFFKSALRSLTEKDFNQKEISYYYFFQATQEKTTIPTIKLLFDLDGYKKGEKIPIPW